MRLLRWLPATLALWLCGVAGWIAVYPQDDGKANADAALVLGAAVSGDRPSPVFAARLDHAITLYRGRRVGMLLLTGGRAQGHMLAESEAARDYAIARGVSPEHIFVEIYSTTTMQNLMQAQVLMREAGIETVLIVSDPLHLARAMAMAGHLGIAAHPSPARNSRYRSLRTQLPFLMREVVFMHVFWLFKR